MGGRRTGGTELRWWWYSAVQPCRSAPKTATRVPGTIKIETKIPHARAEQMLRTRRAVFRVWDFPRERIASSFLRFSRLVCSIRTSSYPGQTYR